MMGDTSWGWGRANKGSVSDDHVAFVDLPQQDGPEVDGPDSPHATRGNSQVASTTPATQPKPAVMTAAA